MHSSPFIYLNKYYFTIIKGGKSNKKISSDWILSKFAPIAPRVDLEDMKKQILVATIVYSSLSVLQPLSNFILLPVYTKYFTESQYGTFSILNNLNIFFSILSGLSIVHAIIAFYTSYDDNKEALNKYVGNILAFTLVFNMCMLLLVSLGGNWLFGVIFKEHIDFFPNGFLTVSYGLLTNLSLGYLFFLKYEKKVGRYAFIGVVQFVLSVVVQYLLIVVFKKGITGALLARVIVALLCFLIIVLYHHRYIFKRINFKHNIKPSLIYAVYTIPSSIIYWLSSYGDRFLIERLIDLKSLGIYSFLSTISSLTEMGFLALGSALQPFIFDFFNTKDNLKTQHLYKLFLLLSACGASLIILVGSNLDMLIHNKGYLEMTKYLTLMTVGYLFSALAYLIGLQIIYSRKSRYFIYIGIIVLVTNLSLNSILIPMYGIWGAVISSVTTKLAAALSTLYFANRSYKMPLYKSSYTMLFGLIFLMIAFWVTSQLKYLSFNISGVLQFFATMLFVVIIYKQLIRKTIVEIVFSIKKR
jgi:O-antigen/teichoic acid export membrane protein